MQVHGITLELSKIEGRIRKLQEKEKDKKNYSDKVLVQNNLITVYPQRPN